MPTIAPRPISRPTDPNRWGKYHINLIGAHVDHVASTSLLSLICVRPSPMIISQNLIDCVTIGTQLNSQFCLADVVELLSDSALTDDCNIGTNTFVESVLDELFPQQSAEYFVWLPLQLINRVFKWRARAMIGGMFVLVDVERPTSEFAEEIACCLALARQAQRVPDRRILMPIVASSREKRLVTVVADMRGKEVLERVEEGVQAVLQRSRARKDGNVFNVYVARWDLRRTEERLGFVHFVSAVGTYLLSVEQ